MTDSDNQQGSLAEQFFIEEITLNHESYSAILQIQRWKFMLRIPGIGSRLMAEAGLNIRQSFFSYVPPATILSDASIKTGDCIN